SRHRAMVSAPSSRQQPSRNSSASTLWGICRAAGAASALEPPFRRATAVKGASSGIRSESAALTGGLALRLAAGLGLLLLRGWGDDRVLRHDVEGDLHRDVGVQLDGHGVAAEGLDRGEEVDALLVQVEARRRKPGMEVGRRDRAEHLAALAGLDHEGLEAGALELLGQRLRAVELMGLALGAALLQRL